MANKITKRHKTYLFYLLVCSIIVTGLFLPMLYNSNICLVVSDKNSPPIYGVTILNSNKHLVIDSFTNHSIILIHNNSDFHTQAANEGWMGNGTKNNPYIISGYYFMNESENLITIENTDVYFIIEHNYFDGNDTIWRSVYITNATNGIYRNNHFNQSSGIGLFSCENSTIANNKFFDNYWIAGYVKSSSNIVIINNTSQGGNYGYHLDYSSFITIINNTIIDGHSSILLENSIFNTIKQNKVYNEVVCNQVVPDSLGICADASDNNNITENLVKSCCAAIYLSAAANNTVANNTVDQSYYGIKLKNAGTQDNLVKNNSISHNKYGMHIWDVESNKLVSNFIHTCFDTGILMMSSNEIDVFHNIISNTTKYAINLDNTTNHTLIQWNDFVNNNEGGNSQGLDHGQQNTFEYNFWAEWTAPDEDNNSYVDYAYSIDGDSSTVDVYPKTQVNQYHYLTPLTFKLSPAGRVINGTFFVSWQQVNDSYNHEVLYFIYCSADAGNSWFLLVADLVNTSYNVDTTQLINDDQYLLKVIARCETSLQHEITTESTFSILNHLITVPTISSPVAGEILYDRVSIDWERSFDSWGHELSYSLFYSDDNGSTWDLIYANLAYPGYIWDTTQVPNGDSYLFKVEGSCASGLTNVAVMNGTFIIHNHILNKPKVIYPNGGETLDGLVTIEWEPAQDTWNHPIYYKVQYSPTGGISLHTIIENTTSTSVVWNTTAVDNGNNYLIRVKAICSEGFETIDRSDVVFTVRNSVESSFSQSSPSSSPIFTSYGFTSFLIAVFYITFRRRRN